MNKFNTFYHNFNHEDQAVEQFEEARRRGIIKSYFLTTRGALNARRVTDFCLWCDEIWSVDHKCECAPDYNCRFTFGEEFEGIAFVKLPRYVLKTLDVNDLLDKSRYSSAHNTLDEVSKPDTSCLKEDVEISDAHQVLDRMSDPNSCLNFGLAVNSVGIDLANTQTKLHVNHPACQGQYKINNMESIVSISCDIPSEVKNDPNMSDAHKVLDEMPLPEFIREMADAANVTRDSNSIECGYKSPSHIIHKARDDSLTYERLLFAKLSALSDSYLWDLVIVRAHVEHFSNLHDVLFDDNHFSDHRPRVLDELSNENMSSEDQPFQVKTRHFTMLHEIRSMNLVNNVVCPLSSIDVDWFMGLNSSNYLGVKAYNAMVFELEIDRMTFLSFKELHSWGKLEVESAWRGGLNGVMKLPYVHSTCCLFSSALRNCIKADPSSNHNVTGNIMEVYFRSTNTCALDIEFTSLLLTLVKRDYYCLFVYYLGDYMNTHRIMEQCKTLEIELLTMKFITEYAQSQCTITLCTTFIFMPNNSGLHQKGYVFVSISTSTLEDKGDFRSEEGKIDEKYTHTVAYRHKYVSGMHIGVLEDTTVTFNVNSVRFWLLASYLHGLVHNYLWLINYEGVSSLRLTYSLALCKTPCVVECDENHVLSLSASYITLVNKTVRSFIFDPGGDWLTLVSRNGLTEYKLVCLYTEPLCTSASNVSKDMKENLRVGIEFCKRNVMIFIFDPGGNDNWQEMMHRLRAYQHGGLGGHRFNEGSYKNLQCYVFDPGGQFMRLIIYAMVTKPRLGLCYVTYGLKYHLYLILEDKDHFKRPVMIHI